jgi:four helix bundle protein
MRLNSAEDLDVYQKGYKLAMRIFELSRAFPLEEKFALTSQIRRSSRSVCLNLREAWAKRRYKAHFVSKLADCDGENSETESSLDFARDCGYITAEQLTSDLRPLTKCILHTIYAIFESLVILRAAEPILITFRHSDPILPHRNSHSSMTRAWPSSR